MKINEIQDLIKFVAKSGVHEVEIEQKDFKITIKSPGKQGKGTAAKEQVVVQQAVPLAAFPPQVAAAPPAAPAPAVPAPAAPAAAATESAPSDDDKYETITSTMIGTFYRSPGPDKDSFVNVGDDIKPGKVICIIEAMKLFNKIESEVSGKIVKILVDDSTPVEFGQPLFLIDPA